MSTPDYWVIRFYGIDGKYHELPNKFTARENADRWAGDMPDWQEPEVIPMWEG